jgi:hypothetical protein
VDRLCQIHEFPWSINITSQHYSLSLIITPLKVHLILSCRYKPRPKMHLPHCHDAHLHTVHSKTYCRYHTFLRSHGLLYHSCTLISSLTNARNSSGNSNCDLRLRSYLCPNLFLGLCALHKHFRILPVAVILLILDAYLSPCLLDSSNNRPLS